MKELILINTKRKAVVDDEDYLYLNQFKWYYSKGTIRRAKNKKDNQLLPDKIRLNREILKFPIGVVDHKDTNIFNNQKYNLRICTQSENSRNQSKPIGKYASKYKGVSFNKKLKKWVAYIRVNRRLINLGLFSNEIEAAIEYNKFAIIYFKEFANLNIILNDGE